ncbi:hypothetical protein Ahy_A04g020483 [Arachis hypogaea]|uniref:DUF1995 domain-containing protein n=1 Tax=Arachis hypogaea TaxID=3818 RepID=A0A445DHU1_ARAHY|nr:hypothetical protein Ahy_A04g020483 [Arachis hypogaea]
MLTNLDSNNSKLRNLEKGLPQYKAAPLFDKLVFDKTVAIAPYIVTYNGVVFRQYPDMAIWYFDLSPWQVMLKQADGSYACIAESTTRFTLGEDFDLEASSVWRS